MERNATIRIKESENGEPVMMTTGTIDRLGNSWNIRYTEDNVNFTIGVSDGIVSISREGAEDYDLILEEGKENSLEIFTPEGEIVMSVHADLVRFTEQPDGLRIRLVYRLSMGAEDDDREFRMFLDCIYDGE